MNKSSLIVVGDGLVHLVVITALVSGEPIAREAIIFDLAVHAVIFTLLMRKLGVI